MYNVGTKPDVAEMYQSGIAYVIIPKDVDRDRYIGECYRTSTVSIYSEHNGVSNRVPVDYNTLNFIKFPATSEELGSAVSFKVEPVQKRPVVDGIYYKEDELCDLVEHQFKFKRELNGNFVELVGSPKGKYLGINVLADAAGEVFINVKSKDESGKVNINVEGECNITSLTDMVLKQFGKLVVVTADRNNERQFQVVEHTPEGKTTFNDFEHLNTDEFKINNGKENFILGQLFKTYIKALITEISNATVTTDMGQMPLINKAQIAEYAKDEKINEFLSTIGFIDK